MNKQNRSDASGRLRLGMVAVAVFASCLSVLCADSASSPAESLTAEVQSKGWIVYGARTDNGDWDLFVMRPDGSKVRNITNTREYNEGLPRFSADGKTLSYRRIPRNETFDNNQHGRQGEFVVSKCDGTEAQVCGKSGEFSWVVFSPDGQNIATLQPSGIAIIDFKTRQEQQRLKRKGFFQQLAWSPDGQWLCGVANSYDTGWSIARMNIRTGEANAVSTVDCCTPDWFPDSIHIVFSRRPGKWTQLWMVEGDGSQRQLLYAEDGRHVYGGCVSPDGRYVLFTGNKEEDGDAKNSGAPMGLMRLSDAPIVGGASKALRQLHPNAKNGPVLCLPGGWEPHWTPVDLKFNP